MQRFVMKFEKLSDFDLLKMIEFYSRMAGKFDNRPAVGEFFSDVAKILEGEARTRELFGAATAGLQIVELASVEPLNHAERTVIREFLIRYGRIFLAVQNRGAARVFSDIALMLEPSHTEQQINA